MEEDISGNEGVFLAIKIISDENFHEYEGFDLAGQKSTINPTSKFHSYRVAVTGSYGAFKQDVISRLGSLHGTDVRFWGVQKRVNGTLRPSIVLGTDLAAWRTWANSRSLIVYVESVIDATGKSLLSQREPNSVLIFLKYFDVAKQRLYGVGKTHISSWLKTFELIDIVHKTMGWTERKALQLYEEIKPGMIERLPLDRTLVQNEIIDGDIICFQELLKPDEKKILSTRFPGFIVDVIEFYKELQKPSPRVTRTPARTFDFNVLPGELFSDALKRTQERMGLLDKDLTNYRFLCAAGGGDVSSLINNFNSQMNCGICMDIFIDPVSFLDCMHLACGACAVEWLSKSNTCPQCRQPVRNVGYNHHTSSIVEAFQKLLPGSSTGGERTKSELAAMRLKYKPGQAVTIQNPSDSEDELDDEFMGFTDDEENRSNEESDDDHSSVGTDLAIAMVELAERRPISTVGCPCCNIGNDRGYLCPDPIPDGTPILVSAGHTTCAACDQKLPVIPDSFCCAVCTRTACPELGPAWACRVGSPAFPIRPLKDIEFPLVPDPSLLRYLTIEYERKAIVTYARDQKLNARSLCGKVLQYHGGQALPRATWHGPGLAALDPRVVKVTDRVCYPCAKDSVAANLFDWWKSIRPTLTEYPQLLLRPDCKFGISCSQAKTDTWHARANNHICLPTHGHHPNDIRIQSGACEDGNRMICEQLVLQTQNPFPFSSSEIQFRDKGGEPVFLCSSVVPSPEGGSSTIPGKMTLWPDRIASYFAYGGFERENHGTTRILIDTQNMCWVRTSKGQVPAGYRPVFGGAHQMSGDPFHHCAVWWKGQRVPGLVQSGQAFACITWAGRVCTIGAEYELLCWRP